MRGPYPGSGSDEDDASAEPGQDRPTSGDLTPREFFKSALVIGGASALGTVTSLYEVPVIAAAADEHEPIGIAARSNRQPVWDVFEQAPSRHPCRRHTTCSSCWTTVAPRR